MNSQLIFHNTQYINDIVFTNHHTCLHLVVGSDEFVLVLILLLLLIYMCLLLDIYVLFMAWEGPRWLKSMFIRYPRIFWAWDVLIGCLHTFYHLPIVAYEFLQSW
jgi:hypothetical protein